jgi:hypothetical protein
MMKEDIVEARLRWAAVGRRADVMGSFGSRRQLEAGFSSASNAAANPFNENLMLTFWPFIICT